MTQPTGQRFTAAVVGLGRIGQGYDYDSRDASVVLTHASGFTHHPAFDLVAGVDPDEQCRERFERRFDRPAYSDIAKLTSSHRPQVWSIGAPTNQHFTVCEQVLRHEPVAILCEKPIATRVADAKRMISATNAAGCALQVNYMRRFEPGVLELRRLIGAGDCGAIQKGVVWYSGGFLNNGSHFIDLLRFLLGEVSGIAVMPGHHGVAAGSDFETDVVIEFGRTRVSFVAAAVTNLSIGEVVLIGTRAMIRYTHGGQVIEVVPAEPDRLDPNRTAFARHGRPVASDIQRYQWHVLDALYRHLVDGSPLNSDGVSATATLEVAEAIRDRVMRREYV
jgi:predicted dehydrogenase